MAFAEDLSVFFNTADFADAALWVGGSGAATVNGILDRDYAEPLGNYVQATSPMFLCPSSAVPGIKHGDSLTVKGVTYKVRGVEPPSGDDITVLRLEQQ